MQDPEKSKEITPIFQDAIGSKILGGVRTEYPEVDRVLYTALMGKNKVMLGGIPETLYHMILGIFDLILGKGLSIHEMRDAFRFLIESNAQLSIPFKMKDAANNFMPHIFMLPKDLYMTAILKESFQAAMNIISVVGIEHLRPIQHYWVAPPTGVNFTQATEIPAGFPG